MSVSRIPLSVPSIEGNEWEYVKECLDTGWVSSVGSFVDKFENKFSEYTGSQNSVACVNGTSALHTALLIVGVLPGDEVLVPTLTFIAPVNVVAYCGARPVFFDADENYNIDCNQVIDFLNNQTEVRNGSCYNKVTGARIGAFLPVHVFGNAVNFADAIELCRAKHIPVVEDATESLGTRYISGVFSGKHTGTIGDIGCFSFNGNKIITTGGGGMLVTSNSLYAQRARYLTTQAKDDGKRYKHDEIGYNYRLTNVLAAIGVAQLEKLDEFIRRKKESFEYFKHQIDQIRGLKILLPPSYANNNLWMFAMQIDPEVSKLDREQLMAALEAKAIETRPVWHLNHLQKPFSGCSFAGGSKALELHSCTLNIPCSVSLTQEQRYYVVEQLKQLCE